MRILFDHGTPAPLISYLSGHHSSMAKDEGWDRLANGELLKAAERVGFDVLITTDKRIRYQQNLKGRKIAIVVLGLQDWRKLRPHIQRVIDAVNDALPGSFTEVEIPRP